MKRVYLAEQDNTVGLYARDVTKCVEILFRLANDANLAVSAEEGTEIVRLSAALDLDGWMDIQESVLDTIHRDEAKAWKASLGVTHRHYYIASYSNLCQFPNCNIERNTQVQVRNDDLYDKLAGKKSHRHVYSSVRRCMYAFCFAREESENGANEPGESKNTSGT